MEDIVSQIENDSADDVSEHINDTDLRHEIRLQYRLARKRLSSWLRNHFKKDFTDILYVTAEEPPTEYIISFQKQYPEKVIKVLVPLYGTENKNLEKLPADIDYFMNGKMNSASLYRIHAGVDNIQIFGVYTERFSKIEHPQDIYKLKNLAEYAKIARKAAVYLKPDIIHAYNIPFLMGLELESRWLSGYPIKFVQFIHNYKMFKDAEPFISAVTFANKNEMEKICSDKSIRKNLAIIFNTEAPRTVKKTKAYINYILKKYDEYRKNVDRDTDTQENVILKRMDERILKLFPKMAFKNSEEYNPLYFSLKNAKASILYSEPEKKPAWAASISDVLSIPIKFNFENNYKIHDDFNIDNFKETRFLNKKYILREFSQKRIELKFFDLSIFEEENVAVRGYLDSFYKVPLIFVPFNEYMDSEDIKTVSLAILKAFELKKNIQVIYNYPKNMNCDYLNKMFDFFESQHVLNGKWLSLEGKINFPQFVSGADMILIPSDNCLKMENCLYNALRFGCIPILSQNSYINSGISDIFDDLINGCVFRAKSDSVENGSEYEYVFLKALDFYTNNNTCWNPIIKNALNYDSSYDFETLEKYNNIYEELL